VVPRRLLCLLVAFAGAPSAAAVELAVDAYALRNGLRVLLHEDHSAPVVASYLFFRAGSRNETRGQTGIAHLFEHMMFNGGKKFGPGAFDDLIEANGGSTNGYTTRDVTVYLNKFPPESLPVVLDLESDRMANLAVTAANLEQERGIVMEERRLRLDNQAPGQMDETLYLHAFVRSPYRWNTVGFMADLERITLDEARAFFRTYYAPNNAILVLAGDIDPTETRRLVGHHFGGIPRRPPPPAVDGREPPQAGERRVAVRRQAELPAVLVGYHGVPVADPDRPALDLVEQLLSGGESARLHRDLVRAHEVAASVWASNGWGIDADLFSVYAKARPGRTPEDLAARIDAVVTGLAAEEVPAAELRKAKNQLRAELVKGLKTVSGKANQLGFFEAVLGDHRALTGLEAGWEAVTAADVRRVVGRYLSPTRRTVVVLESLSAGGAEGS
jgi:predicted Zn-dependent peptidase